MRVYHFLGGCHGISNIKLQRLKVAKFNELNDPFELMPFDLSDQCHEEAIEKSKRRITDDYGIMQFTITSNGSTALTAPTV